MVANLKSKTNTETVLADLAKEFLEFQTVRKQAEKREKEIQSQILEITGLDTKQFAGQFEIEHKTTIQNRKVPITWTLEETKVNRFSVKYIGDLNS